jgi:Holliday junction resolvasome RuvABC DNA-binding subunit
VDLTTIQELFGESLTQEDRIHLLQRLDETPEVPEAASTTEPAGTPPAKPEVAQERLVGALVGLGFNKGQVKNFAGRVGPRLGVEKIENLIREGIQQLS